jgi:anti-sigma B factor antagonist
MMRPIAFDVQKIDETTVIALSGELRIGSSTEELRRIAKRLHGEGVTTLVVDMLDVPWLDSSGLGEVFAIFKRSRESGGSLKLVMAGKALELFTITELHKVLEIYPDRAAALAACVA